MRSLRRFLPRPKLPIDGYREHQTAMPRIDALSDDELKQLNQLLPWASFLADQQGRRFGNALLGGKRTQPQIIPDRRILDLDNRFPLAKRRVLELGCFEGHHTCALAQRAAAITAADARIENVVKTMVRLWAFELQADVHCWDVETAPPAAFDGGFDILHHVGVLYHLDDPVAHLRRLSPMIGEAIMLDTHIATEADATEEYTLEGQTYRYRRYGEFGRADPFSGMQRASKWLLLEDLCGLLEALGFGHIDVAEKRDERNGLRVLIFASR